MQLWILGGSHYYHSSSSANAADKSEIVDDTGSIEGPALPWNMTDYCATKINSTHVVLTGEKKSLIVNHNDNWKMTIGFKLREVRQLYNHVRNLGCIATHYKLMGKSTWGNSNRNFVKITLF